jgi:hypothetical protein
MDFLKNHPACHALLCYALLRPADGPLLKRPYGRFKVAIFYPLGHPTLYAYVSPPACDSGIPLLYRDSESVDGRHDPREEDPPRPHNAH